MDQAFTPPDKPNFQPSSQESNIAVENPSNRAITTAKILSVIIWLAIIVALAFVFLLISGLFTNPDPQHAFGALSLFLPYVFSWVIFVILPVILIRQSVLQKEKSKIALYILFIGGVFGLLLTIIQALVGTAGDSSLFLMLLYFFVPSISQTQSVYNIIIPILSYLLIIFTFFAVNKKEGKKDDIILYLVLIYAGILNIFLIYIESLMIHAFPSASDMRDLVGIVLYPFSFMALLLPLVFAPLSTFIPRIKIMSLAKRVAIILITSIILLPLFIIADILIARSYSSEQISTKDGQVQISDSPIVYCSNNSLYLYNLNQEKPENIVQNYDNQEWIYAYALSPDGKKFAYTKKESQASASISNNPDNYEEYDDQRYQSIWQDKLFVKDLTNGQETLLETITVNPAKDFVEYVDEARNQERKAFISVVLWSKDGSKIAYGTEQDISVVKSVIMGSEGKWQYEGPWTVIDISTKQKSVGDKYKIEHGDGWITSAYAGSSLIENTTENDYNLGKTDYNYANVWTSTDGQWIIASSSDYSETGFNVYNLNSKKFFKVNAQYVLGWVYNKNQFVTANDGNLWLNDTGGAQKQLSGASYQRCQ